MKALWHAFLHWFIAWFYFERITRVRVADEATNVDSDATQDRLRRLATVATLATPRSWFGSCKAWERGVPEDVVRAEEALAARAKGRRVWRHQDVPLFPLGSPLPYAAALALCLPLVACAALLNLPPLLVAAWAGRRFPDGPNVVALWRILLGVPAFLLWTSALTVGALTAGHPLLIAALAAVDLLGLWLWRRTAKLAVAVHNGIVHADLQGAAVGFRELVLTRLPAASAGDRVWSTECAALARYMPHEIVFGFFLATMVARLACAAGPTNPQTLLFAGLLAAGIALPAWARKRSTPGWECARLWFYALALNVVFFSLKEAMPLLGATRYDADLYGIDTTLLGGTPSVVLQEWSNRWLTDVCSAGYLTFFPYLMLGVVHYLVGPLDTARRFCGGLFTVYGIGFLGYSFVPAAGPWVACADAFRAPLAGGWIAQLNDAIVRAGTNGVDVFPSLHCAVSAYILFSDRRHHPRRFLLMLLPCVVLWVSTLYLRYHYAIDVVCGFALAAAALWISRRMSAVPASSPGRVSLAGEAHARSMS